MRDRAWRRKKTESKWNSRCKRFMFDSAIEDGKRIHSYTTEDGIKKTYIVPNYRKPKTWKEMKKEDPWAKYLKNSSTSHSWVSDQLDNKHDIKMQRVNNKKVINEGIQEYFDDMDESFECWFDQRLNEWRLLYEVA